MSKDIVRVCEAHNGLTALLLETSQVVKDDKLYSMDAVWVRSDILRARCCVYSRSFIFLAHYRRVLFRRVV